MRAHRESIVGRTSIEHTLQQRPEMHRDFRGQCHLDVEAVYTRRIRSRAMGDGDDNSVCGQPTDVKKLMDVVRDAAAKGCTK